MDQPGFRVEHAAHVFEPARQLRVGTFEYAGAEPQVAPLERRLLRAARRGPQTFALEFHQVRGIAVLQHVAVLLNLVQRPPVVGSRGPADAQHQADAQSYPCSQAMLHPDLVTR